MKLLQLYKKFQAADKIIDVDGISDCIIEALKLRADYWENSSDFPEKLVEILKRGDTLVYQVIKFISKNDFHRAAYYMTELTRQLQFDKNFFMLYYLIARIHYIGGNFRAAAEFFDKYNVARRELWKDFDELSYFYTGNCAAMLQQPKDAADFYQAALTIKSDFPEVQKNLEVIQSGGGELVGELFSLWNPCDWRKIPIFINARDRLGTMKKLIDWLLDAGYKNLILLDNDSTYPKLLEYYSELEKDSRVKIILLKKNLGYRALWQSNILETLKISTPYAYIDPDVVPAENCPKDFVQKLFEILNDNHEIRKVAPALVWEDITFFDKDSWQSFEQDLDSRSRIGKNLCYSNVDTTFALYSNARNYSLRLSLRTLGDMRIKHLPWYFDYDNLPEDEKYYMDHAEKNFITTVRK